VCAAQLELKLIRLVQLGSTLLGFALFAIALYMGGSLPWVAAGTHVACVLGGLFLLRRIIKARPLARNTTIKDVGRTVRQLLTSSLPFAGIQLTNAAFVALPSLIIAHTMTQIDVATFAVGYKFVTIPLFMVTEIGIVFWPLSTVAWTRGETTWLYTQLRKLILGTVALMLLFSLGSIFFGERIISLWTSGGVNVKTELLVSLAMWLTAQSVITLFSSFLRSVGDFKFELVVNLLSLGTFICIALLVVQKFGLTGIAFALFVSSLVTSLAPMALRVRAKLPQNSALRETKTQMQERDQA
jgi:O-antigen/teichoic acid export membrane protein